MVKNMLWQGFVDSYFYVDRESATAPNEEQLDQFEATLDNQVKKYQPEGFMILECEQFDSSRFGDRVVLPFGPNNTFKEVPNHPVSPRGLASDMSVPIGTLSVTDFLNRHS